MTFGRDVMRKEAAAIEAAAERLGPSFEQAVAALASHQGNVMVLGVGKSGRVGEKIAGTLRSTGTPAIFVHAAELEHGDLGLYREGDPTILISKSGATAELVRAVPYLRQRSSPLIGILGNLAAPLGDVCDIVLDACVRAEAEPYNLAPTASSAVAMALGDALAIETMHRKGITAEQFAWNHPGGQLGRNMALSVADVMHEAVVVGETASIREVIVALTKHPLGAVCVAGDRGVLAGLITDGDLRRALFTDPGMDRTAREIMTVNPVTVSPQAALREALTLMEDRPSQISVLPAIDAERRILGLLRLHDIYQSLLP